MRHWLLDLFQLGAGRGLHCPCGRAIGRAERRPGNLTVRYACIACRKTHLQSFSLRRIWKGHLFDLTCHSHNTQLGYCGPAGRVMDAVLAEDALENLVHDTTCGVRFFDAAVMEQALRTVQARAELGQIVCACGGDVFTAHVYADRVEVVCEGCAACIRLGARNCDDVRILQESTVISLQRTWV